MRASIESRFYSKCEKGDAHECWVWTGARNSRGYGTLSVGGRTVPAHRVSWEITHGPIPPETWILHRCDNPACVNPSHLFLGDNATNVADKVKKGRQARGEKLSNIMKSVAARGERNAMHDAPDSVRGENHWSRKKPWLRVGGERHGRSKLTWADVDAIRSSDLSRSALAKKYGVSWSTIDSVLRGRTWPLATNDEARRKFEALVTSYEYRDRL